MRQPLLLLGAIVSLLLMKASPLYAQDAERTIFGALTDTKGEPLIGANVYVKGISTLGTITDFNGEFELSVPPKAKTLIFSYVGYATKEVTIKKGQEEYNVKLKAQVSLNEVVVTALGIEREEKALGYSVQQLGAGQIANVKPTNVTNALAGKVSGVYVTGSSAGPTASANINIRGAASLLGNNQPLFVVNGMPITNDLYSFDDGLNGSTTIDFGNAAQIVNPDDIESINILKGPAASALYGSRAADGVILIETKTGSGAEGWGVQVNSTTNFNTVLKLPNYQNEFGFGGGGKYSYKDGTNYIGANEYYEAYGENWGPRMNGQLIKQFNSDGEPAPFTPAPDNIRNFFRTGITSINNIAINNATEDGDFRLSYTNTSSKGIVPNTGLNRHTFQTSIGKKLFDERLKVRLNAMYFRSGSGNVPNAGYDESSSVMYGWLWYPRQVEIDDLRQYWEPGLEGVQQRYAEDLWVNNPWFVAYENTNSFQSNRLISNFNIQYSLSKNFSLRLRYGADVVDDQRQYRRAPSTKAVLQGSYREDEISFQETNAEALLSYATDRTNNSPFGLELKVGGNIMRQNANYLIANNPELKFFGTDESIYTLANARSGVLVESQKTRAGINSLFGIASVSFRDFLYLDATLRQDWNSTLVNPAVGLDGSNFSFAYPSVSLSAIVSEMLGIPTTSAISFLKLKGAYAEVGNGAPPYAFGTTFTPQAAFGSNSVFTTNRTVADPGLKNERTRAVEFGFDLRLFNDRFRLDATYYNMLSFDQVINLPVAAVSGYDFKTTNGGDIRNQGIELLLSATPVSNSNFSWDVTLNLGHNRAVVESLPEVVSSGRYSIVADIFPGDEGGADLEYVAEEGELLGQLYGLGFQRAPDGQIIHEDGLPLLTEEKVSAGSYQPDLRAGIYNTFNVGNFSLGFLFDGQFGGNIYSRTHALMATGGTITNEDDPNLGLLTTEGRTVYSVSYDASGEPVYTLEQEGGIIAPGVMYDDNGNLVPNNVPVEPGGAGYTGYFYTYYGNGFNRDNIEAATYDATYVKLREVSLSYTLPGSILEGAGIASARIALVGRNLLLFTNVPSIDPETYSIRNGLFVNGFESTQLPSTRSFGVSLHLGF
ncbi:MAG: SusC/RagA family TonB-linked outer membrane protein [Phaeodactylibacter sp.]|nr:SusC/RagA family TonB-linked outer membrane protein [Phaeodactylibacter sp.]